VVEDGTGLRGQHWLELMEEAGVSPARRRVHARLWLVMMLLTVAAIALSVVSIFVRGALVEIGLASLVAAGALWFTTFWWRRHVIAKIRWLDGTVTFRSVEPGEVGDDGQYVVCRVTLRPPVDITRVATTVGPLDAQHLAVGGTMRCLIDRTNSFNVLRVFPYAQPDAKLPSGRMLKFQWLRRYEVTVTPSELNSSRTRASIWSRTGRTASIGCPAGSGNVQSS